MKRASNFLDTLRLYVKGGTGGNGFPKYGGVGGQGGSVYVKADSGQTLKKVLLLSPNRRFFAQPGKDSKKNLIVGEKPEDLTIPVPIGTTVYNEHGIILGDLNKVGDIVLVAQGGLGGNAKNQYSGQKGQAQHVRLDLKLIADLSLVGFPNAGKSTLLKAISNADPKIASYPFTTLKPNIGVISYPDLRQISIADLPGLIEGAWLNVGMGHSFLRHVERTKLHVFIVDICGFQLGPKYPMRSAIENVILLNRELELFKPHLVEKPAILLANKMDLLGAEKKFQDMLKSLQNLPDSIHVYTFLPSLGDLSNGDGTDVLKFNELITKFCENLPEEMRPENFVKFKEILPCSAKTDAESVKLVKERLYVLLDIIQEEQDKLELKEVEARKIVAKRSRESTIKLV